jgi:gluconate 2-dehydrogenase gamma chain
MLGTRQFFPNEGAAMTINRQQETPRRIFLKRLGTASGAVALGPVAATGAALVIGAKEATAESAPLPPTPGRAVYLSLGPDEAAFVEAMVNVMCPADHLTPGGVDCGLAIFIDRQLAGGFGKGERLYMRGPWKPGKPQLGYQFPLKPEQFFKAGIAAAQEICLKQFNRLFDLLAPADADAFLQGLANDELRHPRVPMATWFNELVYPLFVQACFADPVYGGNGNKVFWKMIGYPGLPANHARNMVEFRGKPYPGANEPKSIADFS